MPHHYGDYAGRSFEAFDADGRPTRLTPLYRLRTIAGAMQAALCLPEDLVGLRTDDGRRVERLGPGRYALPGGPPLTAPAPDAP